MAFNNTQKHLIKIGYLKWKKPTEIAVLINTLELGSVTPLDIHNYIQGKHQEWAMLIPFCAKCNTNVAQHPRCLICERLNHGEECCTISSKVHFI